MTQMSLNEELVRSRTKSLSGESSFFKDQFGELSVEGFTLIFLELDVQRELIMNWTGASKSRIRNICEHRNKTIGEPQKRSGKRNLMSIIQANPADVNAVLNIYHQLMQDKSKYTNFDMYNAFSLIQRSHVALKPAEIFQIFDRYHKIHFDGVKSPFFTSVCNNCGHLYFQNAETPLECSLCHCH